MPANWIELKFAVEESLKRIDIIGGGLAGLTLGIALRQRGIPVRIHEAGQYPRHRVCGEFISGRGQQVLSRLGLDEALETQGAIHGRTVRFYFGTRAAASKRLPQPALCIERYRLDAFLADTFRAAGGELLERSPWRAEGDANAEGLVHAEGRRVVAVEQGWRWFGVKAHASDVVLSADLEMHCFEGGYVGLCGLGAGRVNVCGLFRRSAAEQAGKLSRSDLLRGRPGTPLRERVGRARFEESSFCSVAGLPLLPQRAAGQLECRIGDALTMIPPVTGNGMSMAFEAAALAAEPLAGYSHGRLSWEAARDRVGRLCDTAFARRLRWAGWLQKLVLKPAQSGFFLERLLKCEKLWQVLFSRTR